MSLYILQIETSTEVCSVAISRDYTTVAIHESLITNTHTELLTILIDKCVKELGITYKDLGAIALSSGPGSYTSLRVGAATAKAMCYTLDIPLIVVDSLALLAQGVGRVLQGELIVPMIDARRMEVYLACYDDQQHCTIEKQAHILDDQTEAFLGLQYGSVHLCGSGAGKYIAAYPSQRFHLHHQTASASYMTSLATDKHVNKDYTDIAYFEVGYLKEPNITKTLKKFF
jgi:tRNA threonylcarbamoyladenosine biosynthesis protein TsaB